MLKKKEILKPKKNKKTVTAVWGNSELDPFYCLHARSLLNNTLQATYNQQDCIKNMKSFK